ncbi:MAG: NAD(P)/FAD-dependent oxidoreductase [Acholeplasmataceae bacterium]|nr:MAG: NAD(P)/FAD-dependent oxidoreductase [Acholeplasmataceae bacterium]
MKSMKKVVIIGAGLTGLSAGITLQKNGIQSEIYEMAPWPGGVCTAWTRKGHTFDGCIHWMVGTRTGDPMRKMYEDVGALNPETVIYNPFEITMEIAGQVYRIPMNVELFHDYLVSIAPEDSRFITRFCKELERIANSVMITGKPKSMSDFYVLMTKGRGFFRAIIKHLRKTVGQYAKPVQNDQLRSIIHHLMPPSMSVFALVMMLGTRMSDNGGYPIGGAKDMIKRMSSLYEKLGGKLTCDSKVDEIMVEGGTVKGIMTKGAFKEATHVIAACDMYDTLQRMLKGRYPHPVLDKLLKDGPLFSPVMLVSYGLKRSFDIPFSIVHRLQTPLKTGGNMSVNSYHLRSFDFDPSFAPPGKSSVMVMLSAAFDEWHDLRINHYQAYQTKKLEIAHQLADHINLRYPGFKDAIEVIDVATPSTYHRLNNLYKASYEGFLPEPALLKLNIKPSIKGIRNLYLAGQWTTPGGGIPPAVMSGIQTANKIK